MSAPRVASASNGPLATTAAPGWPTTTSDGQQRVAPMNTFEVCRLANTGAVVLLHPPATLAGFSIVQERRCQQFHSTGMSCCQHTRGELSVLRGRFSSGETISSL